jgi:hypothetical protein
MGVTSLDLFRSGSSTRANLDNVRTATVTADPDVDTYFDANGTELVQANGKGVSTEDSPKTTWRGPAWRLPRGSWYSDNLVVWNDIPGHWTWAPARDMPLDDYKAALRLANTNFVKV